MDEFVSTEKNYIRKLRGLVNTVIKPLKLSCAQDKQPLLKQYLCTNIFLNLEQILDLHEHFLKELVSRKDDFATLCSTFVSSLHLSPLLINMYLTNCNSFGIMIDD